ncbi:unnamed protein product [Cyclocybe aegerita]|uniref:Uncharacterized protein n=1 Tax=Cyclocybe aegerita TaxID=1973307 RepID=A0A8S0XRW1_CYCAE|nr:unnamed protein product [Cyclocybe aegerita]
MALYTTQQELEALIADYRRDLERRESPHRGSLKSRPSLVQQKPGLPSHVCRLWGSLITQSSSLWTCIALGDHNEDEETVFAYLQTVIQRAGSRRLSLSINSDSNFLVAYELLKTVLKVAGRAEWCSMCYESDKIDGFLRRQSRRRACQEPVPYMHRARCRDFRVGLARRSDRHAALCATAFIDPRLSSGSPHHKYVLAPWNQLTNLNLGADMDSLRYLSILQRIYSKAVERDQILLPNLKQLQLTAYEAPALIPWNLQCPALRDATFNYDRNYDEDECSQLISFIGSRGSTLQKLRVPGLVTDSFDEIQDDLKALEELTIFGPFGWPDSIEYTGAKCYSSGVRAFFRSLVDHPTALPRLKILRILDQRLEEKVIVESYVVRFIDSRMAAKDQVSPLQQVVVELDLDCSHEQMERRKKCREWHAQGIRVDFM